MLYSEKYFWVCLASSAIIGYLIGSISFARIITYLKTKSVEPGPISRDVPRNEIVFESDTVSATTVGVNLGRKFGCLNVILDMVKVSLPTWIIIYYFPEEPYYLMVALMGIVGHNYPVYHGFKGGRGMAPLIGGMLIINWFGILIANAISLLLGYLTGRILVMRWGWLIVLIFWLSWYFRDPWISAYIIIANGLFWFSMKPEIKKFLEIKSSSKPTQAEISDFLFMGKKLGEFFDNYSPPALLKKLFKNQ